MAEYEGQDLGREGIKSKKILRPRARLGGHASLLSGARNISLLIRTRRFRLRFTSFPTVSVEKEGDLALAPPNNGTRTCSLPTVVALAVCRERGVCV